MASLSDTGNIDPSHNEKPSPQVHQVEDLKTMDTLDNLVYSDAEEEPELHMRTCIVLAAMFILNLVQVVALQGPPAVLNYIGKDLDNPAVQTWVPNSLSLVQAVLSPIMSSASDTFQARKLLLVGSTIVSFVGAAIAPGSGNIYRLIVAQVLIGVGSASVSLAYAVPSEILPRRWRPMVQALINVAACLGALTGPLVIGAFTKADPINGWRKFYGWVKPGMLGALVGSSGAGKTTLMDVLAQRKTEGIIRGSILVDGRPLPIAFQRSAGYCEQLDVHEPFATVREALEFSAMLRQKREISKEEKLRYVDTVIDLLELLDLENTLIGRIGSGLSVEQRKRVTIGVELVAKPSILIFLDEPTSGLDGQSAFNTLRFLKKLTAASQAVLCTIHQPSAQLFAQFDTLLLLTRGGKTVYFGNIGDESATIKDYFGETGKDWVQVWQESAEHENATQELDRIIADATSKPEQQHDDGHEFATSLWTQTKIVTQRMNVALYRNTDYVKNKFALHVGTALFVGFSFWQIGNTVKDLQLGLFAMFSFIFVAPGVIAQLQPLFIERRDIYDAREKKSKMYSWIAFVTGLIVSEFPYLIICAILFFLPFYWTVGFPSDSNKAGTIFFVMLLYGFFYTGLGQMIAAYAPNAVFASLMNPLVIGTVVGFCGVLVPYSQIQPFWGYWLYYLNPYSYLMGALLTFGLFDWNVECGINELAIFDTPSGQTCQ
ncbi:hypothetical protein LTS15_009481 [Exophiala xenobiotica]|nr:hypothetical protein LTS15_009481 [Exophiala xenobiotica]